MTIRRLTASTLAALLLCVLCATSAPANTPTGADAKPEGASSQPAPRTGDGKEAKAGEKLKADVSKAIAGAREGRSGTTTPPRPQQPQQSNNLSTKQKFAIAAVVVGALAIIYFSVFAGKHL